MTNRRMKLEPAQEARVFRQGRRRCAACGTRKNIQIDHVVSVANGGGDTVANAQLLCGRCNRKKGDNNTDYRGWRGAAPFRLVRRVQMFCERWHIPMKQIGGAVVRVVVLLFLLVVLVTVVPVLDPVRGIVVGWLLGVWHAVRLLVLLGIGAVALVVLGRWWENRQWVAPDEFGQVPFRKSELKRHPEIAVQANQQHQQIRIVQARYQVPEHYAPKFAAPVEAPVVEADAAPLALPSSVGLADVRATLPSNHLALGVLPDGKVLSAKPTDCYHLLFHGNTRSGKSNAMDGIVVQLHHMAAEGVPLRLYAGDKKGGFLATWQLSPMFPDGIFTETPDIAEMLDHLVNDRHEGLLARNAVFARVAKERGRIIRNIDEYETVTHEILPRVFIFVDEINSLLADAAKDAMLSSVLTQALQMGASAGYYLLGGGQHLTANILPTDARNQFVTRAHFGAYNQSAIAMLFGSVDEEVVKPLLDGTPGRGLIRMVGRAEPLPFQALRCDEQDILEAIERVSASTGGVSVAGRSVSALPIGDAPPALAAPVQAAALSSKSASETSKNERNVSGAMPQPGKNLPPESVSGAAQSLFEELGGLPDDREKILLLAETAKAENIKLSRRAISRRVYDGNDTGIAFQKVKAVLDEAGL